MLQLVKQDYSVLGKFDCKQLMRFCPKPDFMCSNQNCSWAGLTAKLFCVFNCLWLVPLKLVLNSTKYFLEQLYEVWPKTDLSILSNSHFVLEVQRVYLSLIMPQNYVLQHLRYLLNLDSVNEVWVPYTHIQFPCSKLYCNKNL